MNSILSCTLFCFATGICCYRIGVVWSKKLIHAFQVINLVMNQIIKVAWGFFFYRYVVSQWGVQLVEQKHGKQDLWPINIDFGDYLNIYLCTLYTYICWCFGRETARLCKPAPSSLAAITLMYGVEAAYGGGEETHLFLLVLLNL